MKLHYDSAADALHLRLADAAVIESEEIRPGIVVDYDANNRIVSVELLKVSQHLPDADVKRLQLEVA